MWRAAVRQAGAMTGWRVMFRGGCIEKKVGVRIGYERN
jgi:hypothetical protein